MHSESCVFVEGSVLSRQPGQAGVRVPGLDIYSSGGRRKCGARGLVGLELHRGGLDPVEAASAGGAGFIRAPVVRRK
jgi:hypothetical protein